MAEELWITIRLEGTTPAKATAGEADVTIDIPTSIIVQGGLTAWADEPYRLNVQREFLTDSDVSGDDVEEHRFSSAEELSTYVEKLITDLRAKSFTLVRYIANGFRVDWLQGIDLPSDS